jgi:cytochrome b561
MNHMQRSTGYTTQQIVLHWLTVLLVALQYVFHEGIVAAFDRGLEAGAMTFTPGALAHMTGGALILGLASWRLLLRNDNPPPPPPDGEPGWASWLSPLAHKIFYILLIALPITGALAGGMPSEFMGDTHGALRAALLFLILAHVGAVILHMAVWKTGLIRRMTRPVR